ncbi:MAG: MFS transporter [Desulfobulbaceae bacterium]|nr:MFS transporter [Desulfobulbaceae bacterium]
MKPHFTAVPQLEKPHNSRFSLRLRLTIFSLILFTIALGFNVVFTSASLDKLYIDSMMSKYRVSAKDLQRKIELGLRYGKTMANYHGLDKLAQKTSLNIQHTIIQEGLFSKNLSTTITKVDIGLAVTSTDGEILFNDNTWQNLPNPVFGNTAQTGKGSGQSSYYKVNNSYVTKIEIKDPKGAVAGLILLSFDERKINTFIKSLFEQKIRLIAMIASVAGTALILFIYLLTTSRQMSQGWPKRKISFVIFLIIGSAQVITCGLFTRDYNNYFFQVNKENATTINTLLGHDIEHLLSHEVKLDHLVGFEIYLKNIISAVPEIKDITYFDRSHQPLYRATKEQVTDFKRSKSAYDQWVEALSPPKNPEFNAITEICDDGENCGYFSINVSKDILSGKVIDIALDSLTIIIISILFFVELLILTSNYFEMHIKGGERNVPIHYGVMRPAAFLFLFGIDISMSFLPLHMENLYEPLLGFSKDTVMGLPISVEFLFVGISILISGVWLDRKGWHPPFITGLFLAIGGILYSWFAPNAMHFVLSRAVVGLGYGLSLMASQGFVIAYSDKKSKAQGLAHLFAGIYAGSICGNATGAIMAEWLGYNAVFLAGAVIIILVMGYTIIFMRQGMQKPYRPPMDHTQPDPAPKSRLVFNFITNRSMLGLILFSSLPAAIVVIGFLNYYSPIYLKRIGASQSTIGQILMLYGICLIYFGPFISRYVDASRNKKIYIFIGCLLGGFSLLTFQFFEGLTAAVLAVLLLGLSSSLVLASQSAFALNLNVTHELGEGKAIAIFRSTSRIGQMLGPIVFSAVIVATNTKAGITWLGVAYLISAILFIVTTQWDQKTIVLDDV